MIKRIGIKFGLLLNTHNFSTVIESDPYYILGVAKTSDFAQIKKAFYKLAREHHPDKITQNDQNSIQFLLIKQAYQAIKRQKGLLKPAGFVYDNDIKSMRPSPVKFQTDDQQNRKSQTDFHVYQQKAEAGGKKYQYFNTTFKTLNDINQIKIKVEKGQIKDAMSRFKLNNIRAKLTLFSQHSYTRYAILMIIFVVVFIYFHKFYAALYRQQLKQSIQQQQINVQKRRIFDDKQQKKQKLIKQFQKNVNIQKYLSENQISMNQKYTNKKDKIAKGENSV